MAHLEDHKILHTKVLLHPVHTLRTVDVLERVVVFPIKAIHDIPLEMLEQIDLALQLIRILVDSERLADKD